MKNFKRLPLIQKPDRKLFFLILSCSGGAGHLRAGEALHRTAPLTGLPIRTEHYDVLDLTSPLFKKLYAGSYLQIVNRTPELWGYLYQQSELKPYNKKGIIKLFDQLNYRRYLHTLRILHPDAILCTHFLPYISISNRVRTDGITAPIFAITTDFDVHQLWIDPLVRQYFVFHEESAWQLHSKQVPEDRITVSGIPLMPEFRTKARPAPARRALGLDVHRFTILILSGGFGMGRLKDIVEQTITTLSGSSKTKFNLLVVCGKNEKARSEVRALRFPGNVDVKIFGFISHMDRCMDASDIVISKAGGLTSSEAMAKSLPMLIVDPIPGQESRNSDMIIEHGAGWKAMNIANLSYKLKHILESPSILTHARSATHRLAKPDAAETILNDIVDHLQSQKNASR
ncbi:MAG: hypothetical protein EHM64_06895 [Ignavibacteriae bacterium]|nr:MAG: hypothetical protein EHM64_06895 [Ignavibacteriota bacterium]